MVQVESFHLVWLHFDLCIKDSSFVTFKMVHENYLNPHEHSSFLFLRFFNYLNSYEEFFAYFKGMQLVQIKMNATLNLVFQISIFNGFSYFKRVLTPCGGYRNPQKATDSYFDLYLCFCTQF